MPNSLLVMMNRTRCWLVILIHFIICLSFFSSNTNSVMDTGSNETDRSALLAFKSKITDDPFGIMKLWNDSSPFCQWHGVTCDTREQRVTQLQLVSLKLGGSISPHIGNLSFLQSFRLYDNNFIHQIPPEMGYLRRLEVVELSINSLGGEIPFNLSNCTKLRVLFLHSNILHGEIPREISFLSKLQHFGADHNNLIGSIPSSFGNLTFLKTLYIEYNNLSGRLPITLGGLNYLTDLSLPCNNISGKVPSSIFNLTSLKLFAIDFNQLGDQILPWNMFHTLPNLQYLSIAANQFMGPIPTSLSNASYMQVLQIAENKLTGRVPSLEKLNMLRTFHVGINELGSGDGAEDDLSFLCSLTNATTLNLLEIGANKFGGKLPSCISNLSSNLTFLHMGENYISGMIPQGIGNLIGLQVLDIYGNLLTGTIPPTIGNLQNLAILYLGQNNLSSWIPTSLGKLTKLVKLYLTNNSLEGRIPLSLQNCTSLQQLSLDQNKLTGTIPSQVLSISSLAIIFSASQNQLTGRLPEEVGKLSSLSELDLSSNMLSGQIPTSLGKCTSMQYLHLQGNNFQGSIPSFVSSMKGLEILDLSSNNLSGEIPEALATLDLIMLNLSFNNFEGPVPKKGVFMNTSAIFLQGNSKLCGGVIDLHLSECTNSTKRRKSSLPFKAKVAIVTVTGIGSVVVVILILLVMYIQRKRRKSSKELVVDPSENLHLQLVSFGDLYRATDGFSEGKLVGLGSFGHVYRGNLGERGQTVAIKVLNLKRVGASRSFIAECEALRNIRHKNLVKLVTVCSGVDYQGNEFKALVYEFMSNGSLQEWLHPISTREEETTLRRLGLLKRISIAIDIASLMEYVHHECGNPLVHCDIKPSNILLDNDLIGHVSDFGLAKFLSDSNFIRASDHPSSSVGVRGTVGYAPPEYGLGSEVSTKGDVYSYGIVLLEMLTGKRPTHAMFKEGLTLHLYAKMALSSGVIEILDPVLQDSFENEDQVLSPRRSMRVMDCLVSVIEIGVACSLESPAERMDMRIVATKLRKIKDNLFRGRN